jgi:hypothetical protein
MDADSVKELREAIEYVAVALHHPDSQGGGLMDCNGGNVIDVSSAIVTVSDGLHAIADSIERLAAVIDSRDLKGGE